MADKIVEVNQLSKYFGSFCAVDHISFEVDRGEIFGFLGANGAGKTTAMKMLCGLLTPSSGEAEVVGYDVFRHPERIKSSIGYMSQRFSLYDDLTVEENIAFYGGIYGLGGKTLKNKIAELVDMLGLQEVKGSLLKSLPLGWKQKLAFSVSMVHSPKLVFLDEPTGGVDPLTRRQFWNMIYEAAAAKVTLFVTTHYMDEAEYCDRISMMVDGRIAALDTPKGLKQEFKADDMNEVFLKIARHKS